MTLEEPKSMDECLYFTNRTMDSGKAMAWVLRPLCERCNEGRFGKPIKKNGKPDKKAEYFECPKCKAQMTNEEAEEKLKVSIKYTCPHCGKDGEGQTEYKLKTYQGVKSYVVPCDKCGEKIAITKKMKEPKKKK